MKAFDVVEDIRSRFGARAVNQDDLLAKVAQARGWLRRPMLARLRSPMDGLMERLSINPHQAAALAYAGLGVLVIFITFAADLVPRSREDAVWQLVIGAVFVLVFAVLI